MNEIVSWVEEAPEEKVTVRALGESIFIEADDLEQLCVEIRDAVRCHFQNDQMQGIRLHYGREEVSEKGSALAWPRLSCRVCDPNFSIQKSHGQAVGERVQESSVFGRTLSRTIITN